MHLLLLRHGQTDENASGILQGHAPTELNALGRRQAMCLADRLKSWVPRPDVLVTSDLARARQTAEAVGGLLGLPWQPRAAWRERAFGPFEGRPIGEASVWRAASGQADLPGAESTPAFHARIVAALDQTLAEFPSAVCVAVVSHGGVLRNILALMTDGRLPLAAGAAVPEAAAIPNCAIMHVEVHRGESGPAWRIHTLNDVDHLADAISPMLWAEQ